jgi:ubiquitin
MNNFRFFRVKSPQAQVCRKPEELGLFSFGAEIEGKAYQAGTFT